MASKKQSKDEILASFFDEGTCTKLFADGAVCAAFGAAGGQPVYAVCQNGEAVSVQDIEKNIKVLDLAAQTGNPVVTIYDSIGAKLAQGQELVAAQAALSAKIGQISGVVPQIAVVVGVCAASSALAAASADICIMAEGAELFFTAPFTSEAKGDKVPGAGTATFAAKAGVAAIVEKSGAEAVKTAAKLVAVLPANNLSAPAVFSYAAPSAAMNLKQYDAVKAAESILDLGAVELYAGFGKNVYTALGTVNGNAVGVVSTLPSGLCHNCASKAARFVRFCDAFSIPVITVVNTEGFVQSSSDDLAGGIREAARLAGTYADATTAKIAVCTGKAVGSVYSALCNADVRIAVEGCTIAPVEPTVAAAILYQQEIAEAENMDKATKAKAAEYAEKECGAAAAVCTGTADCAVKPADVRAKVVAVLDMLTTKRTVRLAKKHGNMAL